MSTVHRNVLSGQSFAWYKSTLIVIAAGCAPMAGVLHAGVHDWTQPEGANFYISDNWDPQAVPGVEDTARFNLGQGPYWVTFAGLFLPNPETACVFVRHDDVIFDLHEPGIGFIPGYARTYTLNATGDGADASLVLGQGSHDIGFSLRVGNLGRLTVERGTLEGVNAVLGLDRSQPFTLFWRSRGELIVRPGATADFSEQMYIGYGGRGGLYIDPNATVNSGSPGHGTFLGYDAGSSGEAMVSGQWNVGSWLNVGDEGVGSMTITAGGNVTTVGAGEIAKWSGSSGQVLVSGQDALWGVGLFLRVGDEGAGELSITSGGRVNASWDTVIGRFADSGGTVNSTVAYIARNRPHGYPIAGSGTVSVDGPDSSWNNATKLFVGYHGQGTLDITSAASVSNRAGVIGRRSGSHSHVSVDSPDSTWTNSGSLRIGFEGHGTLAIIDGASLSNTWASVAYNQGATGHVAVTGPGASWASSSMLVVGDAGDGALTIADGGSVRNTDGRDTRTRRGRPRFHQLFMDQPWVQTIILGDQHRQACGSDAEAGR